MDGAICKEHYNKKSGLKRQSKKEHDIGVASAETLPEANFLHQFHLTDSLKNEFNEMLCSLIGQ